jgi:alcohol dehydrogenase class IV
VLKTLLSTRLASILLSLIRSDIETFKAHQCDIIVAVGGGSAIDASKAILWNLAKEWRGPALPRIAIPTTLSAAEYTVGRNFC